MFSKKLSDLGSAVGAAATEAAQRATDTALNVGDKLTNLTNISSVSTETLVDTFIDKCTPITVPACCVPNGPDVNNYDITFDTKAFIDARVNGPFVSPKIVVYAATDELDRDLLGQRLSEGFENALQEDKRVATQLREKSGEELKKQIQVTKGSIDGKLAENTLLGALIVILGVLGVGFLAPFLVVIGVQNNVNAGKDAVRLMILKGKLQLSKLCIISSGEEALAEEIETAQRKSKEAFERAMKNLPIHVDHNLASKAKELTQ